ncbi:MAG: 3-dehydroquinate synthase [Planctomycetaceae bacterium]
MSADRTTLNTDACDISFNVPMIHRLRFTEEVAGEDFGVLLGLLPGRPPVRSGDPTDVPPKVLVWADDDVARASDRVARIASQLLESEQVDLVAPVRSFTGGEAVKNAPIVVETMLQQINDCNLDRRSYIIAIGGGALLDVAGYAAAIAHRGVRLVRLPTTTLAQADSGVGVKNAINYFGKKNWVGTFAVPWGVINDAGFLTTLPEREFACGFSEAVKVSLLKSPAMFEDVCAHAAKIAARDMFVAKRVIAESCRMHLRHITEGGDPFESLESRPLDFGHWSAHRMEPLTNYTLRHGEAVALGVALDTWYSSLVHGLPRAVAERVCRCLADLGLPLWDDSLDDFDRLLVGLEEFRQHLGGRLTVTMLRNVGDPIDVHEIDTDQMREAATQLRSCALRNQGQGHCQASR